MLQALQPRFTPKVWCRLVTCAFGIIGVGVLGKAMSMQHIFWTDSNGIFYEIFPMIGVAWSTLWSLISLSLFLMLRKPYHPAIDIFPDFSASGLCIAGGCMLAYWQWLGDYRCYSFQTGCERDADLLNGLEITGIVAALVAGILSAVLFGFACRDTHRRRLERKNRRSFTELNEVDVRTRK